MTCKKVQICNNVELHFNFLPSHHPHNNLRQHCDLQIRNGWIQCPSKMLSKLEIKTKGCVDKSFSLADRCFQTFQLNWLFLLHSSLVNSFTQVSVIFLMIFKFDETGEHIMETRSTLPC